MKAWSLLPDNIQSQKLTIVGKGRKEGELRNLVRELNISNSIIFEGSVSHNFLPDYYRRSRLLVFPSVISSDNDQEGLGLVPIEAIGCRCPVLASRIEPLYDVIEDKRSGYFFEMANVDDLALKMEWFFEQRQSWIESNSDFAEISVRSKYDWNQVAANYNAIYSSALAQGV